MAAAAATTAAAASICASQQLRLQQERMPGAERRESSRETKVSADTLCHILTMSQLLSPSPLVVEEAAYFRRPSSGASVSDARTQAARNGA